MKVLIIFFHNNGLNPVRGNSTRIWTLIKALASNGIDISLLHSANSKFSEDIDLKQKCKVYYHKNLKIFGLKEKFFNDLNPFLIFKLFKILKREKFDIIQIEYPYGFFALKLLLLLKKNFLIYDSHNVESEIVKISVRDPKKFPRFLIPIVFIIKFWMKVYESLVCRLSNLVINVSKYDQDYYIQNYKINKNKTVLIQTPSSILINNNINVENLRKISRIKLGLPLNKTIIISHGSLPHPPNLESFNLIIEKIAPRIKDPDVLFVLAGKNLKKFKKNNIISLGFVKDLKDFLLSGDFAIVPIISGEGMRIKCSDYISVGIPFVSTKKGIQGIDFLKNREEFLLFDNLDDEFINGIEVLIKDLRFRNYLKENLLKKSSLLNMITFEKKVISLYSYLLKKLNNS